MIATFCAEDQVKAPASNKGLVAVPVASCPVSLGTETVGMTHRQKGWCLPTDPQTPAEPDAQRLSMKPEAVVGPCLLPG
jgi:hypothetical protein